MGKRAVFSKISRERDLVKFPVVCVRSPKGGALAVKAHLVGSQPCPMFGVGRFWGRGVQQKNKQMFGPKVRSP